MKHTKEEKLLAQIIFACGGLGWSISLNTKSKTIKYLIIGEQKAVEKILKKIEG